MKFNDLELRIFNDELSDSVYERKLIVYSEYYDTTVLSLKGDKLLKFVSTFVMMIDNGNMAFDKDKRYSLEDLMEYTDNTLSPLEQRVVNWVLSNTDKYDELVKKGFFSADIVDYCVANDCEDIPFEWVVPLLYKESK